MSGTEKVRNLAGKKLPEEAIAAELPPAVTKKPVKEKKTKAAKEKNEKTKKTVSHPPYFQMIEEALVALKEKNGSSPYAIAKVIEEKHKAVLPANFKKMLGLQLKNFAAKGKLIKIKASYKLSESNKKAKGARKAVKKSQEKATEGKYEPQKKKVPKRKSIAAIAKPKQPKSIKSLGRTKANKASA